MIFFFEGKPHDCSYGYSVKSITKKDRHRKLLLIRSGKFCENWNGNARPLENWVIALCDGWMHINIYLFSAWWEGRSRWKLLTWLIFEQKNNGTQQGTFCELKIWKADTDVSTCFWVSRYSIWFRIISYTNIKIHLKNDLPLQHFSRVILSF